jgi:hypothetical protein
MIGAFHSGSPMAPDVKGVIDRPEAAPSERNGPAGMARAISWKNEVSDVGTTGGSTP